jgi:hypothetical protein
MIARFRKIRATCALLTALTAVAGGWAEDAKKLGVDRPAKARTLFGITWQPSRAEALKKATPISAKDPAHPVFLVQMLGDLAGHT